MLETSFRHYIDCLRLRPLRSRLTESEKSCSDSQPTVCCLYFETLEIRFMFSLTFWKLSLDFNLEYLSHFFINFNNQ